MSGKVMKLNDILHSLDDTTEKVASDTSVSSKAQAKKELLSALDDVVTEKTASVRQSVGAQRTNTPSGDLEKIAGQIAAAEEEALIKEAHMYGAAVCDGFMAKMAQYERAAEEISDETPQYEKRAYYRGESDQDYMEKRAAEAAEAGYNDTMEKAAELAYNVGYQETMEKVAQEAAEAGYHDTMEKAAAMVTESGYDTVMEAAEELLKEAGETEVLESLEKAAFESGYEVAMEKIASSAFEQGYSDMRHILSNVG